MSDNTVDHGHRLLLKTKEETERPVAIVRRRCVSRSSEHGGGGRRRGLPVNDLLERIEWRFGVITSTEDGRGAGEGNPGMVA